MQEFPALAFSYGSYHKGPLDTVVVLSLFVLFVTLPFPAVLQESTRGLAALVWVKEGHAHRVEDKRKERQGRFLSPPPPLLQELPVSTVLFPAWEAP